MAEIFLIILLVFLSINGFAGGYGLVSDRSGGNLKFSPEMLERIPLVKDYFLPGLFLLLFYGAGALVAAYGVFIGASWGVALSILISAVLLVWVLGQLLFFPKKGIVQLLFFALGLAILWVALSF